jgi:hypothetical protein
MDIMMMELIPTVKNALEDVKLVIIKIIALLVRITMLLG